MKKIATTIFALLFSFAIWAQVTAKQLLASAWDDPAVQRHREQQAYLENNEFNMSLLRKLELRTETRDLDLKQQEYAVRLSTNGFGMKRTQTSIYNSMKELNETERLLLVQDELLARYELLLDLHFDQRSLELFEAQKLVLLDKKTVFAQQFSLGLEQDLDDFFRTEEDLLQLERKKNEVTGKRPGRQFLVTLYTGKTDSIETGNLINTTELLARATLGLDAVPPSVKREQMRAQLATLEEEMERMEGNNLLNYLQFRYTGNANDLLEDRFSFGAGVNLPWPNGARLREQELRLESLEAQAEADKEQQAAQRAASIWLNEVGSYLQEYLLLEKQIDEFRSQYSPQRLQAGGLENPETLLRVEETILKLQLEKVEVEKKLFQSYIGLLNETGLLLQPPARNWLSPEMELIGR